MSILDLLNKYRYEIKLNKTGLYNFVTGGNKELAGEGFNYKLKTCLLYTSPSPRD